jgi:hypothetical protein
VQHPTFNLENEVQGTILKPGKFQFGTTFPGQFEPSSLQKPSTFFQSLDSVEGSHNKMDFSRLPLKENSENLLQLCGIDGTFELHFTKQKYYVKVHQCSLFILNRYE